ncbi:MAG: hydrogenase maturation protease [Gammaproteobacteria bacterium]|nr:hydrogenase maturation protease [Gammaproteobacteria bacterium]
MIRVIGLGSPFGDDDAGWRVVERLRGRLPAAIDLQTLDRPGAALINWFEGVSHLLIIDAISGHPTPGKILHLAADDLQTRHGRISSHHLDLQQTLALASVIHRRPARIEIMGVSLGDPNARNPAVETGCTSLVAELAERFSRAEEALPLHSKARTAGLVHSDPA